MWSWVAHRVTGFAIFFFLLVHVADTAMVRVSPEAYNTVIGAYMDLSNADLKLVDNATKYSTEAPDITIRTYNTMNNVIISVTYKGSGMINDEQEKIFDQFYRIPTGNIHNVKGFGLGLSYVSDIVQRLDGKIQVKSEKDKGTTFEVIMPLKNKQDFN